MSAMADATGSLFGLSLAMAGTVAAISPLLVRTVGYSLALAGLIVIGWANDRNFVWRDKVKNWERGPGQEYSHAKGGLWRTWLEQ